jgi:DNA-binding NarL/FixJ family response regulator
MAIRILIADDHAIVRAGLRTFLAADPELEIVGEARNGLEAVEMAVAHRPDVVLMDLLMPEMDGVAATAAIRKVLPHTEVVALTTVIEDRMVVGVIKAGAIGYFLKDIQTEDLLRAIKAAAAGRVELSPQVSAFLMRELQAPTSPEPLSRRETEVLAGIARGESNKEIAAQMGVAVSTIKSHVANLLGKLGVESRTQAALCAVRMGLM